MSDYANIIKTLEAKLERQKKMVKETEEHLAAIKTLQGTKK